MTQIYMQLKTTKRAYTRLLNLGEYITSTNEQLDSKLAQFDREVLKPDESTVCTYIGSIKQWNAKGVDIPL